MRLEIHEEAREELLAAVSRYEAEVPGLGARFVAEIELCLRRLVRAPLIGSPHGRKLRRFVTGGKFPFSVIYVARGDIVYVVAFAHHSRRPAYWKARAK